MSHVSPAAPCSRRMPTELFCMVKESCAPPGKWKTSFIRWFRESQMLCKFIKGYWLQLRYGSGFGERALMSTCAVYYSDGLRKTSNGIKSPPAGKAWLMGGCDMPTLSPSSCWNVPVAKKPKVKRICTCGGTELDFVYGPAVLAQNDCKGPWEQLLVA